MYVCLLLLLLLRMQEAWIKTERIDRGADASYFCCLAVRHTVSRRPACNHAPRILFVSLCARVCVLRMYARRIVRLRSVWCWTTSMEGGR
ncbi:hypothetical protein EDB80DRAFT_331863 [Ilyonectria destructans]|nr:hypothetical protein EDB80DRAFT_331863 [Ilyonectria destructans]